MIVKKLILHRYKRFFLNKIDTLEYTPNKPMQIILGTNGCGKSQLLRQLNPLPANLKNEFYDKGYKYIEIEHLNKLYILSSGYVGSNKHSFIVDELELNPGGTRKVQLDLVYEHFKITPDIIEILLNNNRLTIMPPNERKKWISELSNIDYRYSIGVYNKLRARHRDLVGGIKLLQDELVKSESNNIDKDQLEKLKTNKSKLEEYYDYINSLYLHKNNNIDIEHIKNKLLSSTNNISILTKPNINLEEAKQELTKHETLILEYNKSLEKYYKELSDLEKTLEPKDKELLLDKYKDITDKVNNLSKQNTLNLEVNNIKHYCSVFSNLYYDIVGILNELHEYKDIRLLSKEDKDKIISMESNIKESIELSTRKLQLIEEELKHLNDHKSEEHKVSCPKCSHSWYNGYDINKVEQLTKEKDMLITKIDKLKIHNKNYTDKKTKIEELNNIKDRFRELLKSNWELKPVLEYILKNIDFDRSDVLEMITVVDKVNILLDNIKDLTELTKEKESLEQQLKNLEDFKQLESNRKEELMKNIHTNIDKVNIDKVKSIEYITKIKNDIINYDNYTKYIDSTNSILKELRIATKSNMIQLRNRYLQELASYVKEEIITIDKTLQDVLSYENKYKKDSLLLEDYKKKEKVLKLMVKELSPNEGLIAKSINSFLNVFVKEMNYVINKIWSYDIELLTCDITDEDDLDYKFKVKVNNDEIIEDISKMSSSMKEIVDLAFRLVFCKYMKLVDVPLVLDEFASSFDKNHREEAYKVIDKILSSDYLQVYIVCHFESLYGSLSNCDFNVLSTNNIELGSVNEYNKNMLIK